MANPLRLIASLATGLVFMTIVAWIGTVAGASPWEVFPIAGFLGTLVAVGVMWPLKTKAPECPATT